MKQSGAGRNFVLLILSLTLTTGRSTALPRQSPEQTRPKPAIESRLLTPSDKKQLGEVLRIKETYGGLVWPGFDAAVIPLILYNGNDAFLVLHPSPPPPWNMVDSDSFNANSYYHRESGAFQAFAVKLGDLWAGSLDTLDHMNQSMEAQIRENVPAEKITPVFLKMMEITPAWHAVALLHEAFHAFQAMQRPERFQKAVRGYSLEEGYPYDDEAFKKAWNEEGQALAAALLEKDDEKRPGLVLRFLEIRDKRRSSSSLPPELAAFERDLEWLEGSAKFVEMQFAELGASDSENEGAKEFTVVRGRLRVDFFTRLRRLGELSGDGRFYLSGAAQAMLLDFVREDWKAELWSSGSPSLEALLREAMK